MTNLVMEPEEHRFSLVWRTRLHLQENLFEVPEVLVGKANRGRRQAGDALGIETL